MHRSIIPASIVAAALGLAVNALAGDLAQLAIPQRWIEEYLPEKLPELKFPAYFDDLDKARALAFAGHYKASLIQLTKVAKGNPAEIARIKATSLAAVGRRDEAISILSQAAVKDDPQNQVLRARITAELGQSTCSRHIWRRTRIPSPDIISLARSTNWQAIWALLARNTSGSMTSTLASGRGKARKASRMPSR